jgi:hypothetical protein
MHSIIPKNDKHSSVEGEEVDHRTVSSDYVLEINKEADKTITAFYSLFRL